jgi:hypothetical protein
MSAEPTHAERNRSATDSPDALGRHKAVTRPVPALRPSSSGCRRPVRPAVGPPDGAASRCGLPGGAGDVRGDDVGSVPVQASAGPGRTSLWFAGRAGERPVPPGMHQLPSGSGKAGSSRQPTADTRSPGSSERRHPLCWCGTATMAALRTHVSYRLTPMSFTPSGKPRAIQLTRT